MTGYPVTPGELVDTTWLNAGVRRLIAPRTAVVDINTLATERSMYDGSAVGAATGWKIPANVLGTDRGVRLRLAGDLLHNNGAGDTLTVRIRWGNATVIAPAATSLTGAANAARASWEVVMNLHNLGATNAQHIWGTINLGNVTLSSGTGVTSYGGAAGSIWELASNQVLDTTADQYLDVSATWSVSSVNNSFRCKIATCEVLG